MFLTIGLLVVQQCLVFNLIRFDNSYVAYFDQHPAAGLETLDMRYLLPTRTLPALTTGAVACLISNAALFAVLGVGCIMLRSPHQVGMTMIAAVLIESGALCYQLRALDIVTLALSAGIGLYCGLGVIISEFAFMDQRINRIRTSLDRQENPGQRPLTVQLAFDEVKMWIDRAVYFCMTVVVAFVSLAALLWSTKRPLLQNELMSVVLLFVICHMGVGALSWVFRPLLRQLHAVQDLLD